MFGLAWRFLLGNPVASSASASFEMGEVRMGFPLRNAPFPLSAEKSSSRKGS